MADNINIKILILVVGLVGLDLPMKADVLTVAPSFFSTSYKISTMSNQEVWKDIEEYNGIYQINNFGEIKSLTRIIGISNKYTKTINERILIPGMQENGYLCIVLSKKNNQKTKLVHRIVALTFIPNPLNKPCVNHKDGNKLNNHVPNLEWVTHQENADHAWVNGYYNSLTVKNNHFSKKVIQYTKNGEFIKEFLSTMDVQRELGIDNSLISKVALGKTKTCRGFVWKYKKDMIYE